MPIVFNSTNKRGDYNGYFTNSLNQQGVGSYGSTVANKFIQDAKNGADCLDVVIIGDSNANYNNRGWIYGWEKALADAGAKPYATCLVPFTHSTATNVNAGHGIGVVYNTLQAGSPAWTLVGSTAATGIGASQAVNTYWNNDSNELRTWAVGLNWLYISSTSAQQATPYVQLSGASALSPKQALVYRVGYIQFAFGGGRFYQMCYAPDYSANIPDQIRATKEVTTVDGAGNNYSLQISEMTVSADAARGNTRFGCLGQGYGTQWGPVGPVGLIFESVYAKVNGFAVNMLNYYPGATTAQTASRWSTANAKATAKTYLTELRNRQIAAGGTGRVLVFVNSSINDVAAANIGQFDVNANSIVGTFASVWASAGYPPSDLAFVISRTHPTEVGDANQAVASSLGKGKIAYGASHNVTFIDTNELTPQSYLNSNSFYDGGGPSHLTVAGYEAAGSRLITALLK